ncbi:MAG: OB-fold nucleic acid binding domain-containing protein [Candidatus Levyibacteriota bacterium]
MKTNQILITVIVSIIVGAAAFAGGMQYQKSKISNPYSQFAGAGGNGMRRFGGGNGMMRNGNAVVGEILSKDDTSITVKLNDGSSKIVLYSDKTPINKAAKATKDDLTTGERVAVFGTANSDGSVTAQDIQLNPQVRFNGQRPTGEPAQ